MAVSCSNIQLLTLHPSKSSVCLLLCVTQHSMSQSSQMGLFHVMIFWTAAD